MSHPNWTAEKAAQRWEKFDLNQSILPTILEFFGGETGWFRFGASREVDWDRSHVLPWPVQ
ncbi:unnamed protein product [Prunus armeniaca]